MNDLLESSFVKMPVHSFCPFFIWVACLFFMISELLILDSGTFLNVLGRLSSALWVAFLLFCWIS